MPAIAHVIVQEQDNVATLIGDVKKGDQIKARAKGVDLEFVAEEDIPYGHKIALEDIKRGETVFKYGLAIGSASVDIKAGDYVHVHNIESDRGRGDLKKEK